MSKLLQSFFYIDEKMIPKVLRVFAEINDTDKLRTKLPREKSTFRN